MREFYGVQRGSARSTPTMIRVIRICRKCGAKIFSDAPEGLCAKCILRVALDNFPDAPVTGVDDPGRVDEPSRDAVPRVKTTARAAELLGQLAITNYWKKSVAAVRAWYFARGRKVSI